MKSSWEERNERNKELLQQKALTLQRSRDQIQSLYSSLSSAKERLKEQSHYLQSCALFEERALSTWKIASGRASTDKADAESATRAVKQKQTACDAATMRDKLSGAGNEVKRKNDERLLRDELIALQRIEAKMLDISDASEAHLAKATLALSESRLNLATALRKKEEAEKEVERLMHELNIENAASNKKAADYHTARELFSVSTPTLEPRHIRAKALTSTFLLRDNSLTSTSLSSSLPSITTIDQTKSISSPTAIASASTFSGINEVTTTDGDDFVIGLSLASVDEEMDKLPFKVRPAEPVGPCSFQPVARPLTLRGLGTLSLSATEPVAALASKDWAAYDNSILADSPRRPVTVAQENTLENEGMVTSSSPSLSSRHRRRVPMVPEHLSSANGDLDELRLLRTEMESSLSALQTATKDLEDFALKNPRDIDAIDAVTRSRATARRYLQSLEDVSKTFSLVVKDVENAVRPPTSSPRDIGRQVPDYLT